MTVPMVGLDDLRIDWSTYGGPYLRLPCYGNPETGQQIAKLSFSEWAPCDEKKDVATFIVEACKLHGRHEQMLAALKEIADVGERDSHGNIYTTGEGHARCLEIAKAAVARAIALKSAE